MGGLVIVVSLSRRMDLHKAFFIIYGGGGVCALCKCL